MRVFICHPYQNKADNLVKTAKYCRYAIAQGHHPIAPAIFYSSFLNDGDPEERKKGRQFGLEILEGCGELWICGNIITEGMAAEINEAYKINTLFHEIKLRHVDI